MIHTLEPGHPSAPRAEVFERTLDVLAEHFDMKPVGELPDAVAGPRPLAALTFDDGFLIFKLHWRVQAAVKPHLAFFWIKLPDCIL